jgi:glycosyltransferase involved in cell wall biosynthesis
MNTDVVIPVFNEERRLADNFPRLHAFLAAQRGFGWKIIIANNGSNDGTQSLAERLSRSYSNVNVSWIAEKGRGGSVKRCWFSSQADVLVYMDVDLATDLEALPTLVQTVASGAADLAIGSRLLKESQTCRSWRREIISRVYIRLVRLLCDINLTDPQCGFKAISRLAAQSLLPRVKDTAWFFDTELLIRAVADGWQVAELPVKWTENRDSRVSILPTAWGDFIGLCRLRSEINRDIELSRTGGSKPHAIRLGL